MESLGRQLQKEREARGISLKDISLQTKIGVRYLEAIENDRLDLLPGGFFTRQILKTYLLAIGLEPGEWLSKYLQSGSISPEARTFPSPQKPESGAKADRIKYYLPSQEKSPEEIEPKTRKEIRIDKAVWISLTVIVLTLFVFLIYLSVKTTQKNVEARNASQKLQAEAVLPVPEQTTQVQPEAPEPAPQPLPIQGLELDLSCDEDCWIQVYSDGNLIVDGLKLEGFKTKVRAESELTLNLGNAGGVSFVLNGMPGKPFGKRGAVLKNIRITRENLDQFLSQAKKSE